MLGRSVRPRCNEDFLQHSKELIGSNGHVCLLSTDLHAFARYFLAVSKHAVPSVISHIIPADAKHE